MANTELLIKQVPNLKTSILEGMLNVSDMSEDLTEAVARELAHNPWV